MRLSENRLRGIFWGGLTGGLGSCLPILALVNCLCCLWAWLAGAMAVALIRGREQLTYADAPKMGALAGAFAGLVSSTGQLLYRFVAGPSVESMLSSLQGVLPETIPEQSIEMFEGLAGSGIAMVIVHFLMTLFLIAIFAMFGALGGMLYIRLLRPSPTTELEAATGAATESD